MIRPGAGSVTVHLAWISRTRSAGAIKSKMGGGLPFGSGGRGPCGGERQAATRHPPSPPGDGKSKVFNAPAGLQKIWENRRVSPRPRAGRAAFFMAHRLVTLARQPPAGVPVRPPSPVASSDD